MQIIGTRINSTWRVPADWFMLKRRFTPGVDPTTGGPVCVVEDFTDTPAGYQIDCNPDSRTFRQAIPETRLNPPVSARAVFQGPPGTVSKEDLKAILQEVKE